MSAVIGMSLRADHAHCCPHCAIARGAVDARREKRGRDGGTGKVKHTCVGGVTSGLSRMRLQRKPTDTQLAHVASPHAASRSHTQTHAVGGQGSHPTRCLGTIKPHAEITSRATAAWPCATQAKFVFSRGKFWIFFISQTNKHADCS
jgi:hypothetical protein